MGETCYKHYYVLNYINKWTNIHTFLLNNMGLFSIAVKAEAALSFCYNLWSKTYFYGD